MDLGLRGRTALVCGASKGLGRACAEALLREGVHVTVVARDPEALDRALAEMQALAADGGGSVQGIAADITTPDARALALAACPAPDILVTNAGGPPPGNFRQFGLEDWRRAVENNMLTPIALIQATIDGMMARGFGRIVNITSATVKAPMRALDLSIGARSGLTGFIATVSREAVARNVTVNNLLPGPFVTDRLRSTLAASAEAQGQTLEARMEEGMRAIPAGRFGEPAEFGALCAFVCSAHMGYMTGQNLLIDGGAYPGVF